jgi:DNA-binding transcriptional regulator GbsR (MarR family)
MGDSFRPPNAADFLTVDDISEMFGYSKSSITTKFKQTA